MSGLPDCIGHAAELLRTEGIDLSDGALDRIARHVALIGEWNRRVSLVSAGDLAHLWERHVVDSLGLAAIVAQRGGQWLDIGSGGGFPALPVAAVLPAVEVLLLERSERKVGFLRRAVASMALPNARVVFGEFPREAAEFSPSVITARAVEKPAALMKQLTGYLPVGAAFLAQFDAVQVAFGPAFHVERVDDAWSRAGLRRGTLAVVTRAQP